MILLKNISKIYVSKKSKTEVVALDDITLSFESKGLNFILGPSGCGKSTLLNLIGGLDYPTNGELYVNHQKIGKNENQLDDYRNQYIGFIFQDFNLIPNLTLYDNLVLVCFNEKKEIIKNKIEETLKKVGLEGYQNRYPSELSGGQIQRVAIARALLKNSRILLADEPTGNLNSEISKEIMELFYELAKEKLVIIVSHNEELATQYANRIIRLKDGKIIQDSNPQKIIEQSKNQEEHPIKNHLSTRTIWKMTFSSLGNKKFDSILSIFILLLSFISLFVSFSFVNYNRLDTDVKNITNMDKKWISVVYDDVDLKTANMNANVKEAEVQTILKKYPELTYIRHRYVNNAQDLIQMGYHFYDGYKETVEDGLYVNNKDIEMMINYGRLYYDQKGETTVLKQQQYDFESLTGTYYKPNYEEVYGITSAVFFEIRGILYYEDYKKNNTTNPSEAIYYCKEGGKYDSFELMIGSTSSFSMDIGSGFLVRVNDTTLPPPDTYCSFSSIHVREHFMLLTDKGLIYRDELNEDFYIEDDEIYISLGLYNAIYQEHSPASYYLKETDKLREYEIINYPTHIGEKIKFDFQYALYPDYQMEFPELTLKGIYFESASSLSSNSDTDYQMVLSSNLNSQLGRYSQNIFITILKDSIPNIRTFLKDLLDLKLRPLYDPYSEQIKEWEDNYYLTIDIFKLLLPLFIIISFLIAFTYIKRVIKRESKEIGILRSIGIKKKDILKIYLNLILMISIFIVLVTCLTTYFVIGAFNAFFIADYAKDLNLFFYKWWFLFVTISFVFIINYGSSYFSLRKLVKRKTIDIIRNE